MKKHLLNTTLQFFLALTITLIVGCEDNNEDNSPKEGRKDYENGYYIGEFNSSGQRHGTGTFYWSDGDKYEGQWSNGSRSGQGTYTWVSGAKYEGQWENGSRSGHGKHTYSNGNVYEGNWKEGTINGQGTFTFKDGSTFSCNWENGTPTDHKSYFLSIYKDNWYYWKDKVGKIDAKDYSSAEDILEKTKYHLDKYSYILDLTDNLEDGFSIGYGISVRYDRNNQLRVSYVVKNGAADLNGVKKGWRITHINGSNVSSMDNINMVAKEGEVCTFTFIDDSVILINDNHSPQQISLTASKYRNSSIIYSTIIQQNQKKIGYLVLRTINSVDENELLTTINSFSGNGINELVLDLRYCAGGNYALTTKLAGYIAPNHVNGKALMKRVWHEERKDRNEEFLIEKNGPLNLSRIFTITSSTTDNTPEYLIHGLSAYMNIIKIGSKSKGEDIYGKSNWRFKENYYHLLVSHILTNGNEETILGGLKPDYNCVDGVEYAWGNINEDCLSASLFYIANSSFPVSDEDPLELRQSMEKNKQIIEPTIRPEAMLMDTNTQWIEAKEPK